MKTYQLCAEGGEEGFTTECNLALKETKQNKTKRICSILFGVKKKNSLINFLGDSTDVKTNECWKSFILNFGTTSRKKKTLKKQNFCFQSNIWKQVKLKIIFLWLLMKILAILNIWDNSWKTHMLLFFFFFFKLILICGLESEEYSCAKQIKRNCQFRTLSLFQSFYCEEKGSVLKSCWVDRFFRKRQGEIQTSWQGLFCSIQTDYDIIASKTSFQSSSLSLN